MDVRAQTPAVRARPDRSRAVRLGTSLLAGFALSLIATAVTSARTQVTEIDFHVFYESARAWRSGTDLYATAAAYPNLNPPHFVVAFAIFTWFSEHVAIEVWMALNLAAALVAGAIVWTQLKLPRSFVPLTIGVAAAGLSTGVLFGLEEGHPIGLFALCVTAAWAAHRQGRQAPSGLLLGLLVSVKPFFGCILLVPLVRREWRLIVCALATAAAAAAAGVLLAGVPSVLRWVETGRQVSWFQHPLNASLAGLLARSGLGWLPWTVLVLALLTVTIAALRWSASIDASWLAAGLASLLVSPLGWAYYLPLLAGPLAAITIRRPALLVAGLGFVWPVPFIMTLTSVEGLAASTICSIMTWSLIAMWGVVVHAMLRPRPEDRVLEGQLS
jgi:arabinofuranan 3-O-arabinosyltransferase